VAAEVQWESCSFIVDAVDADDGVGDEVADEMADEMVEESMGTKGIPWIMEEEEEEEKIKKNLIEIEKKKAFLLRRLLELPFSRVIFFVSKVGWEGDDEFDDEKSTFLVQ